MNLKLCGFWTLITVTLVCQSYGTLLGLKSNLGKLHLNVGLKDSGIQTHNSKLQTVAKTGNQAETNAEVTKKYSVPSFKDKIEALKNSRLQEMTTTTLTTKKSLFQTLKVKNEAPKMDTTTGIFKDFLRKIELSMQKKKDAAMTDKMTKDLTITKNSLMHEMLRTKAGDKYQLRKAVDQTHILLGFLKVIEEQSKIQTLENDRTKEVEKYMAFHKDIENIEGQWHQASEVQRIRLRSDHEKLEIHLKEQAAKLAKLDYQLECSYKAAIQLAHKYLDDIDDLLCDKNIELKLKDDHNTEVKKFIYLLNSEKQKLNKILLNLLQKYAVLQNSQMAVLQENKASFDRKLKWLKNELECAEGYYRAKLQEAFESYQADSNKLQTKLEKQLAETKKANRTVLIMEIDNLKNEIKAYETKLATASPLKKRKILADIKGKENILNDKKNELAKYNETLPVSSKDQIKDLLNKIILTIKNLNTAEGQERNELNTDLQKALEALKLKNQKHEEIQKEVAIKADPTIDEMKKSVLDLKIKLENAFEHEKPQIEKALQKAQEELEAKQKLSVSELPKKWLNKAKVDLEGLEDKFSKLNQNLKDKSSKSEAEALIELLENYKNIGDIIQKHTQPEPLNKSSLDNNLIRLINAWRNASNDKKNQLEKVTKQTEAGLSLMNSYLDKMRVNSEETKLNERKKAVAELREQESKLQDDLQKAPKDQEKKLTTTLRRITTNLNNEKAELESQNVKWQSAVKTALANIDSKSKKVQDMLNHTKFELEKEQNNLDPNTKKALEKSKTVLTAAKDYLQDLTNELNAKLQETEPAIPKEDKTTMENKLEQLKAEGETATGDHKDQLDEALKQTKAFLDTQNSRQIFLTIESQEKQLDTAKEALKYLADKQQDLETQLKKATKEQKPQLENALKKNQLELTNAKSLVENLESNLQKEAPNALKDLKLNLNNQKNILKETQTKLKEDGHNMDPKTREALEKTKSIYTITIPQMEGFVRDLNDVITTITKEKPENLLEKKQKLKDLDELWNNAQGIDKDILGHKRYQDEIDLTNALANSKISEINIKEKQHEDIEDKIEDLTDKVAHLEAELEKAPDAEKPALEVELEKAKNDLEAEQKLLVTNTHELENLAKAAQKLTKTHLNQYEIWLTNALDNLKTNGNNIDPNVKAELENVIAKLKKTIPELRATESLLEEKINKLKLENVLEADLQDLEDKKNQLKQQLENASGDDKVNIEKQLNDVEMLETILKHKLNITKPENIDNLDKEPNSLEEKLRLWKILLPKASAEDKQKLEEKIKEGELSILLKMPEIEAEEEKRKTLEAIVNDYKNQVTNLEHKLKTATAEDKPALEKALEQTKSELKKNENDLANYDIEMSRILQTALNDADKKLNDFNSQLQDTNQKLENEGNEMDPQEKLKLENLSNDLKQQIPIMEIIVEKLKNMQPTAKPNNQEVQMENKNALESLIANLEEMLKNATDEESKNKLQLEKEKAEKELNNINQTLLQSNVKEETPKHNSTYEGDLDVNEKPIDPSGNIIPDVKEEIPKSNGTKDTDLDVKEKPTNPSGEETPKHNATKEGDLDVNKKPTDPSGNITPDVKEDTPKHNATKDTDIDVKEKPTDPSGNIIPDVKEETPKHNATKDTDLDVNEKPTDPSGNIITDVKEETPKHNATKEKPTDPSENIIPVVKEETPKHNATKNTDLDVNEKPSDPSGNIITDVKGETPKDNATKEKPTDPSGNIILLEIKEETPTHNATKDTDLDLKEKPIDPSGNMIPDVKEETPKHNGTKDTDLYVNEKPTDPSGNIIPDVKEEAPKYNATQDLDVNEKATDPSRNIITDVKEETPKHNATKDTDLDLKEKSTDPSGNIIPDVKEETPKHNATKDMDLDVNEKPIDPSGNIIQEGEDLNKKLLLILHQISQQANGTQSSIPVENIDFKLLGNLIDPNNGFILVLRKILLQQSQGTNGNINGSETDGNTDVTSLGNMTDPKYEFMLLLRKILVQQSPGSNENINSSATNGNIDVESLGNMTDPNNQLMLLLRKILLQQSPGANGNINGSATNGEIDVESLGNTTDPNNEVMLLLHNILLQQSPETNGNIDVESLGNMTDPNNEVMLLLRKILLQQSPETNGNIDIKSLGNTTDPNNEFMLLRKILLLQSPGTNSTGNMTDLIKKYIYNLSKLSSSQGSGTDGNIDIKLLGNLTDPNNEFMLLLRKIIIQQSAGTNGNIDDESLANITDPNNQFMLVLRKMLLQQSPGTNVSENSTGNMTDLIQKYIYDLQKTASPQGSATNGNISIDSLGNITDPNNEFMLILHKILLQQSTGTNRNIDLESLGNITDPNNEFMLVLRKLLLQQSSGTNENINVNSTVNMTDLIQKYIYELSKKLSAQSSAANVTDGLLSLSKDQQSIPGKTTIIINSNGHELNSTALDELRHKMPSNVQVITTNSSVDGEQTPGQISVMIKSEGEDIDDNVMSDFLNMLPSLTNARLVSSPEANGNLSNSTLSSSSTKTINTEGDVPNEKIKSLLNNVLDKLPDGTKIRYSETNSVINNNPDSVVQMNDTPVKEDVSNMDIKSNVNTKNDGQISVSDGYLSSSGDSGTNNGVLSKLPLDGIGNLDANAENIDIKSNADSTPKVDQILNPQISASDGNENIVNIKSDGGILDALAKYAPITGKLSTSDNPTLNIVSKDGYIDTNNDLSGVLSKLPLNLTSSGDGENGNINVGVKKSFLGGLL